MFGSRLVCYVAAVAMFSGLTRWEAAQHGQGACLQETLEGEIRAGQGVEHPIGRGLKVVLETLPWGWILRVVPANGPGANA